jgi:hypothetical protein
MTPHPESNRIKRAMQRCLPLMAPWSGDIYRFSGPTNFPRAFLKGHANLQEKILYLFPNRITM